MGIIVLVLVVALDILAGLESFAAFWNCSRLSITNASFVVDSFMLAVISWMRVFVLASSIKCGTGDDVVTVSTVVVFVSSIWLRVFSATELANVNSNNVEYFIKINRMNTFEFDNIFLAEFHCVNTKQRWWFNRRKLLFFCLFDGTKIKA